MKEPMRSFVMGRVAALAVLVGMGSITGCDDPHLTDGPSTAPSTPPDVEIQLDSRPPVFAASPPPPISGGGLLVTKDGTTAIAGDAARDRLSIIDLEDRRVVETLRLDPGARPGRLVEDSAGNVHVVLTGTDQLLSVDRQGKVLTQHRVCHEPRGVAYVAADDRLILACRNGRVMSLNASGDRIDTIARLQPDLRDVVVVDGQDAPRVFVSRFREASLTEITVDGDVVGATMLPDVELPVPALIGGPAPDSVPPRAVTMAPFVANVAWRTLAVGNQVVVLHQRAMQHPIATHGDEGYGQGCRQIVKSSLSTLGADGVVSTTAGLAMTKLTVDVAVSPDGQWWALADVGASSRDVQVLSGDTAPVEPPDAEAPVAGSGTGAVEIYRTGQFGLSEQPHTDRLCDDGPVETLGTAPGQQVAAVAFNPQRPAQLVALVRQPASLLVKEDLGSAGRVVAIDLGGDDVTDTGHDLFHRVEGALACAHCHPLGTEDGRVWEFQGLGPRRTQSLEVGVEAPFHWDGELNDFEQLMSEVFVRRMHGRPQSDARSGALATWVQSLPVLRSRAAEVDTVDRGRQLFESPALACASCHGGPNFTDGRLHDVGTSDVPLKTPSLLGVSKRLPLMHDGCAATLRARFDAECGGGDLHGLTSELEADDVDALVAYLEML